MIKNDAKVYIFSLFSLLKETNYTLSPVETKDYNFEFSVKDGKDSVKVQVYFGKKGVKTILQGNADTQFYADVNKIVFNTLDFPAQAEQNDEPEEYIGSDESGKGDVFGPLVICAFYADADILSHLKKMGVRDSKELSDNQIFILADKIKNIKDVLYETVLLAPPKYNELYNKFNNLNKMLDWAHSTAIENILKQKKCDNIIIDKFSIAKISLAGKTKYSGVKFFHTPKAERFTAVAAASIIARNEFNFWFEDKAADGYPLLKGASKEVEALAQKILNKHGSETLSFLSKTHFKTIKNLR